MKFEIVTYDSDGAYISPDTCPTQGAYEETYTVTRSWHCHTEIVTTTVSAIDTTKVTWQKSERLVKPDKAWFEHGHNHRQSNEALYHRDLDYSRWCIDLETLDDLLLFLRANGGAHMEPMGDGDLPRICL